MSVVIVEQPPARAEDRALLGSNPSADPGAKTERRAMSSFVARLSRIPFGIGMKALNHSRLRRESWTIDMPGDGLPVRYNSERRTFHFTLNHYKPKGGYYHCPAHNFQHQRIRRSLKRLSDRFSH